MMIYELESFNCETRNATSIPCLKSSHFRTIIICEANKFIITNSYHQNVIQRYNRKILRIGIKLNSEIHYNLYNPQEKNPH